MKGASPNKGAPYSLKNPKSPYMAKMDIEEIKNYLEIMSFVNRDADTPGALIRQITVYRVSVRIESHF